MNTAYAFYRRSSLLLAAGCLCLLTGCWMFGNDSGSNGTTSTEDAETETGLGGKNDSDAIVDGWPEPQVALVLTGEQHGYLEPCGCSETQ